MEAQPDSGFVDVRVEPAPSPMIPPPARARGDGGAPTTDPLASFLMGSGITQSATVADVLRGEQVHDPGSFLALDADDVVELLATAKAKGVSVGDRAKLKALIRASGNTTVPETPRPSPRQPSQGIASLRAQFDTAAHEHHEQHPTVSVHAPPAYSQAPPSPQHQHQHQHQHQPPPPTTPTAQWQDPPRTPYPAQQSPPPPPPQAPTPPPRDHEPWPREPAPNPAPAPTPAPAPAPARRPRSPFRNPFAGAAFAQANGFFEALMVMLGPARTGAADFLDAMVARYVKPVLDGRGFEAFGYGGVSVANGSARQSWVNSTMPRLLLFYGIFRGFVAMTTRVDAMMAFFIGFFLRKRDRITPPEEQQQ